MDKYITDLEDKNGMRFSFHVLPSTDKDVPKLVVPIGSIYTPLKTSTTPVPEGSDAKPQTLPYRIANQPVPCGTCKGILNPYSVIDYNAKLWTCPFCLARNRLPAHYGDITPTNQPTELHPMCTTLEYILQRPAAPAPVFLFVIDLAVEAEELNTLKESILMALALIPEHALVGLITFGTTVQLYELACTAIPKAFVFNGASALKLADVKTMLGFGDPTKARTAPEATGSKFIQKYADCDMHLESILEELQPDARIVPTGQRALRATGVALGVATALMEAGYSRHSGRIMLFSGGECTQGPGKIVSHVNKEILRAHHDLLKEEAPHVEPAAKYYSALADRISAAGHVVDIFSCTLHQTGIFEMGDLLRKTGGLAVISDTFADVMFKKSFAAIFEKDERNGLGMVFNGTIKIQPSKELKIKGAIGHVASMGEKSTSVSENVTGVGGTSRWKAPGLDANTSIAFYFEVVNKAANPLGPAHRGLIQLTTQYENVLGQTVLRVTTFGLGFADLNIPDGFGRIKQAFDQEAGAVLMSRLAVWKTKRKEPFDIMRWLDQTLIKMSERFASFTKGDPSSFALPPNFNLYPQFMFYLRRCPLLQVFNSSPDETTFFRYFANRENVTNTLSMIQPTLDSYSFTGPPEAVLLSATSLQADRILVLDTFFYLMIWYGETIAQWKAAKYEEKPEYATFAELLKAPRADTAEILKSRFPQPRFIDCDQHTSQARFLTSVVDPAITHTSMAGPGAAGAGEAIMTEDVNLGVFMEHLKKLIVSAS